MLYEINRVIQLGFPNGFAAWAIAEENTKRLLISVGCHRDEPLSLGLKYWSSKKHPHYENRQEIVAALVYAEAVAKLRGWVVD